MKKTDSSVKKRVYWLIVGLMSVSLVLSVITAQVSASDKQMVIKLGHVLSPKPHGTLVWSVLLRM